MSEEQNPLWSAYTQSQCPPSKLVRELGDDSGAVLARHGELHPLATMLRLDQDGAQERIEALILQIDNIREQLQSTLRAAVTSNPTRLSVYGQVCNGENVPEAGGLGAWVGAIRTDALNRMGLTSKVFAQWSELPPELFLKEKAREPERIERPSFAEMWDDLCKENKVKVNVTDRKAVNDLLEGGEATLKGGIAGELFGKYGEQLLNQMVTELFPEGIDWRDITQMSLAIPYSTYERLVFNKLAPKIQGVSMSLGGKTVSIEREGPAERNYPPLREAISVTMVVNGREYKKDLRI